MFSASFLCNCLSCFTAAKISFTSTVSYYAHNYHSLSLSLSHYHYHCNDNYRYHYHYHYHHHHFIIVIVIMIMIIVLFFFIVDANFDINIPNRGTTDYATTKRPMPPLKVFTVCMWIRVDESQASEEHSVFSYAAPGLHKDNEILIFFTKTGLYFQVDYKSSG